MVIDNRVAVDPTIENLKKMKKNIAMSKQKEVCIFKFSLFWFIYLTRYVLIKLLQSDLYQVALC